MSREAPLNPEKQPHWSDAWQPFHDHWEEILRMPLDFLAIAEKERESHEGHSDLSAFGLPNQDLNIRRELVDELVGKGGVSITLGSALENFREIYSRGDGHIKQVLLSIFEDVFRPYIHSRIYAGIMQELRSHKAFQAYAEK